MAFGSYYDDCPQILNQEMPAKDKHSSLLQTFVINGCKEFYYICVWLWW